MGRHGAHHLAANSSHGLALGAAVSHAVIYFLQKADGREVPATEIKSADIADELRLFQREYARVWHLRNRPSEHHRIQERLLKIADTLDKYDKTV